MKIDIFYIIIGVVVGITLIVMFPVSFSSESVGVITDFEVSAGGFGHSDLCAVTIDNGSGYKISKALSGNICSELETGKKLVFNKSTSLFGFWPENWVVE